MAGLFNLPDEILDYILHCNSLTHVDLYHCFLVSRKFSYFSHSNELWRKKVFHRYPEQKRVKSVTSRSAVLWKDVYRGSLAIHSLLTDMTSSQFANIEVSDTFFQRRLQPLIDGHGRQMVIDILISIIHLSNTDPVCNLTEKYYSEKAMTYVHHVHLRNEWTALLQEDEMALLHGAALLAQWFQVDVLPFEMYQISLNTWEMKVRENIRDKHGTHPILNTSQLENTLDRSLWKPAECRQVLECVNEVLYSDVCLVGNSNDYYDYNNSFINKVIDTRKGIPITLCILHSALARRLGVLCESVNAPGHFLLRFLEHPHNVGSECYTYIDPYERGAMSKAPQSSNIPGRCVAPRQVFLRMLRNLINIARRNGHVRLLCHSLELYTLLEPSNVQHLIMWVRVLLHLNINYEQALPKLVEAKKATPRGENLNTLNYLIQRLQSNIESARQDDDTDKKEVKLRSSAENVEVQYSVGMIMKHRRYDYYCVVYGWDQTCKASADWILQMGVMNLANKDKQPFYNVLVDDGSHRYAAQESLCHERTKEITHQEVGKYFCKFSGFTYLANSEVSAMYPEDLAATRAHDNMLSQHTAESLETAKESTR